MNLQKLFGKRAKLVKPWIALAAAATLALLGVYAFWGLRFVNSLSIERAHSASINQLSVILSRPSTDTGPLRDGLETSEEQLRQTSSIYAYQQGDYLVRIVADAAVDAGVKLEGVAAASEGAQTTGDVRYATQSLDLWLSGSLDQVISFLELLDQRTTTVDVAKFGLKSQGDTVTAEVHVVKYHSPESVPAKSTKQ